MSSPFQFTPLAVPVTWAGRYSHPVGKESVFRARSNGSAYVTWTPWNSGLALTSYFVDGAAVRQMVKTINGAKQLYGAPAGGSFQINEYGQVICPVSSNNNLLERYKVGDVTGVPTFLDPRKPGSSFELQLPPATLAGAAWDRPYVGMKFNLDVNDSIYFQEDDGDGKRKIRLDKPDPNLVQRLWQVRGRGQAIRFIVNLHGMVLTKTEPNWQPVFVGTLNLAQWFTKQP
jgi:hypothetical protein